MEAESSSSSPPQKRKRDQDACPMGASGGHSLGNGAPIDAPEVPEPCADDLDFSYEIDEDDSSKEDYGDDYDDDEYVFEDDEELDDDDDDDDGDDCSDTLFSKFEELDLPPGVEATVPWMVAPDVEKKKDRKQKKVLEDDIDVKFRSFKQFDCVQDFSDHNYAAKLTTASTNPSKEWARRVQHEWKLLENDLPDTIFVRVYEERMDLLRAVIIGPAGTPYHDGLFFFDVQFPASYPNDPPNVYYHSGGLRLNPNLYDSGYVCLSLLGTWQGDGCEKWKATTSTMLQVLVSIQALVLNEKPYFNEPGYERFSKSRQGETMSTEYNENTFVKSCRTMLYSLRKPPKYFEDFVAGHFRYHGRTILTACKAYMDGLQVGSAIQDGDDDKEDAKIEKKVSLKFRSSLKKLFEDLLMEFTVKGADCNKFLAQKVKAGAATAASARAAVEAATHNNAVC